MVNTGLSAESDDNAGTRVPCLSVNRSAGLIIAPAPSLLGLCGVSAENCLPSMSLSRHSAPLASRFLSRGLVNTRNVDFLSSPREMSPQIVVLQGLNFAAGNEKGIISVCVLRILVTTSRVRVVASCLPTSRFDRSILVSSLSPWKFHSRKILRYPKMF